jgi:hypothetical protein
MESNKKNHGLIIYETINDCIRAQRDKDVTVDRRCIRAIAKCNASLHKMADISHDDRLDIVDEVAEHLKDQQMKFDILEDEIKKLSEAMDKINHLWMEHLGSDIYNIDDELSVAYPFQEDFNELNDKVKNWASAFSNRTEYTAQFVNA